MPSLHVYRRSLATDVARSAGYHRSLVVLLAVRRDPRPTRTCTVPRLWVVDVHPLEEPEGPFVSRYDRGIFIFVLRKGVQRRVPRVSVSYESFFAPQGRPCGWRGTSTRSSALTILILFRNPNDTLFRRHLEDILGFMNGRQIGRQILSEQCKGIK